MTLKFFNLFSFYELALIKIKYPIHKQFHQQNSNIKCNEEKNL